MAQNIISSSMVALKAMFVCVKTTNVEIERQRGKVESDTCIVGLQYFHCSATGLDPKSLNA